MRTKNTDKAGVTHYSGFSRAKFGFASLDTVSGFTVAKGESEQTLIASWSAVDAGDYAPLYTVRQLNDPVQKTIEAQIVTSDTLVDLRSGGAFGDNLAQGKVYYFDVSTSIDLGALKDTIFSDTSRVDSGYTKVSPPQLTASYGTIVDSIEIKWNKISAIEIDSVRIKYSKDQATWDSVAVEYATPEDTVYRLSVQIDDISLPIYIKARFEESKGNSDYSKVVVGASRLKAPKNLTVSKGVSADSLRLKWENYRSNTSVADDNTSLYTIYMRDSASGIFDQASAIQSINRGDVGTYDYSFKLDNVGALSGIFYYFKIGGRNDVSVSDSLTNLDSGFVLPPKIYISECSDDINGKIEVSWALPSEITDNIALYEKYDMQVEVQRRKDGESFVTVDSFQGLDTLSFVDSATSLTPKVPYYYRARLHSRRLAAAVADDKELSSSAWSDSVAGQCLIALSAVRLASQDNFFVDSIQLEILHAKNVDSILIKRENEDGVEIIVKRFEETDFNGTDEGQFFPWTDTVSLQDGKLYKYYAQTKKDSEASEWVGPTEGYTRLDSCLGLDASKGVYADKIRLRWDEKSDADGYSIFVREKDGKDSMIVASVANEADSIVKFVGSFDYPFVYGPEYRLGVSAFSVKFKNTRVGSDTVWTQGYLKPKDIDSVWISQDLTDSIVVRLRYVGGHEFDVWRKIDGGSYAKLNALDWKAEAVGAVDSYYTFADSLGGADQRVNGAYYYYKIVAKKAGYFGVSDTLNTEFLAMPGYSRIDTTQLAASGYPNEDSIFVEIEKVKLQKENLAIVRYGLLCYSDENCTTLVDSIVLADTSATIFAQLEPKTVKKGAPYWFKVRSLAYATASDAVPYSVSERSAAQKSGIELPKAAMSKILVRDTANLVYWASYPLDVASLDSVRVYRKFVSGSFEQIASVSGEQLVSGFYVDKGISYGEFVEYYVKAVIENGGGVDKQVSAESDTLDAYCYLPMPENFAATKGAYADTIKLSWEWNYASSVDSFLLSRYLGSTLDTSYVFASIVTEYFDTARVKEGVAYAYYLKSKKNNAGKESVVSQDSASASGYAKFSPPDTLIASISEYSITLRWGYKNGTDDMASDVQYLVVRDTTQASVWSGNILDSVVNGEDTFFVDASVPHGMVRWYKVAAFNDISKEQVLSKPVRGFSIFDPLTITRSDKGLDDTIIVKWEKEQAFKSYFVEWSTKDSIDEETQKFRFPVDSLGSFENSDYTTDSAVIKITEDSLKGRKIYIRVWAQNDFGKSEPTQSEGWVKLEKPDLIDVTDGQLQDSLALKIKRSAVADEDNSLRYQISFKKNKEDLFVKGYYELDLATATPSGDSIILDTITLQNSDAGFVYYVGVRAVNDLPNTMSGAIIDSGYSRLPAVNLATGEPLEGYINISWLKKNIGGDTLNYFVCKSKVNVGTVDTIDTVYGVDVLEMVSYNDSAVTVSENYEYFVYSYAPTRFGEKFSDSSNHVVNFAKIGLVDSLRQVEDYKRDTILMIWKQIPAVDSYVVYRSEDNDVDNKVAVDTLVFTEAPFTDKSADLKNNPGKIFYYWIAGLKGSDRGPVREIGAAAFTKLEMVDEIFAGKGESTQGISLKWSKSDLATSYNVFFDTLGGSGYDFLAAIGVEDDDTSHIFYRSEYSSEFSDGVQYLFRVQPVNEYCIAEISDTSVAVDTGYLKLLPVDSFYFYYDSVRFDTIKLNWAEETTPNLYYYLYRSVDKNGEKTLLDSMQADTNYYIDKGKGLAGDKLVGGKKYWYYLTTAVQGLKGGSSDTVEVQTYNLEYNIGIYDGAWSKLPEPAFITASGVFDYATKDNKPDSSYADSVVIRWSRVENAQSYALVGDTAREFVYSDARYQMSLTSDSVYNLSLPELEIADLG